MLLRRFGASTASRGAGVAAAASRCAPTWASPLPAATFVSARRCSNSNSSSRSSSTLSGGASSSSSSSGGLGAHRPGQREPSINCVTLVGVVHDIQSGFVFEDAVTQFTLTTTSLDTTNPTQECVVEKDHHTVRCFGDVFSQEVRAKLSEGNVVCVNGRLRLNPQQEPSCNKYYYFPYIQVQPPHGQVSVVYGDRRAPPAPVSAATGEVEAAGGAAEGPNTTSNTNSGATSGAA